MEESKNTTKYYLKLTKDFYSDTDLLDTLFTTNNGTTCYLVYTQLYMVYSDGKPYFECFVRYDDFDEIASETLCFSHDQVKEAFAVFMKLGLMYEEKHGFIIQCYQDNNIQTIN